MRARGLPYNASKTSPSTIASRLNRRWGPASARSCSAHVAPDGASPLVGYETTKNKNRKAKRRQTRFEPLLTIEHNKNISVAIRRCCMLDDDGLPLDEVGSWAKEKHERLRKYVDISRAVRRKFLNRSGCATYIDLFCGSGRCFLRDTTEKIDGSPLVAFKSARDGGEPFSEIHIADLEEQKVAVAAKRIADAGGTAATNVGKAEDIAPQNVSRLNPYGLHFAFLDPYNLDALPFSVIEAFGRLKHIDMLIHVSALDLQRNLDFTRGRKTIVWSDLHRDGGNMLDSISRNREFGRHFFYTGPVKWRRLVVPCRAHRAR